MSAFDAVYNMTPRIVATKAQIYQAYSLPN